MISAILTPAHVAVDNGNIFALPCTDEDASLVVFPVPWEVTVSYRTGTANGPEMLRSASLQVDLYDEDMGDIWKYGIYMPPHPADICETGRGLRKKAADIIEGLARGESPAAVLPRSMPRLSTQFRKLYERIESATLGYLQRGKIVGIAGGDHSVPLGALRAYARLFKSFGILHIDAHADLRSAYEGFVYSHASIMRNVLDLPQVERIVQVGVRDFCKEEADVIAGSNGRVKLYSDAALKSALFCGKPGSISAEILSIAFLSLSI